MSETDGFVEMIDWSNAFFTELRANNTKEWFEPRKSDFIAQLKKPSEIFADLMAEELSRITGDGHSPKVFRIYRDVRFSKDKTPYNTHLHILWNCQGPAFFFGSDPEGISVLTGIMGLKGDALTRYRAFVDSQGATLAATIDSGDLELRDFGEPPLKRVPKPYDPDHPHAEFLKRKSLIVRTGLPADWRKTGLIAATRTAVDRLIPVRNLLLRAM